MFSEPGKEDVHIALAPNVTSAAATASAPMTGSGWSSWHATLEVHRTGIYEFSLADVGDTWLTLGGQVVIGSAGLHGPARWSTSVELVAGRRYPIALNWFAVIGQSFPRIGLYFATPEIQAAATAAASASVAVVFAGETSTEGFDRPNLNLPGDGDALIEAVAAANPHTVVVLNTGGAILMPWLHQVAGVLEAWYPGQEDGTATAAVLDGAVDPSGHLPVTFPAGNAQSPVATPAQFPGIDATVNFSEGLDIGYRWFQANDQTPLFPFGFGLSYTKFKLSHPTLTTKGQDVVVTVSVANVGDRSGATVVQVYEQYPAIAGEPPHQLRGFDSVALQAGQRRTVSFRFGPSDFEIYLKNGFSAVAGRYGFAVGLSSAALAFTLHHTVRQLKAT
jgi:beta-glucosidase